jgi:HAD superfamily hydrolase (TIGR01509 family)
MERLRTIFFDVGNTLLFPDRERMLAPLHQRGVFPDETQWHLVERQTKQEFDKVGNDGRIDHGFWQLFYTRLLRRLEIQDPALHDSLVQIVRQSANWCIIRPGTRDILEQIGAEYDLAVISNADGKIADVLAKCGIADCFREITDSGLVGHEKPHAAIFKAALQNMNAVPAQSLYVGDVYSVDYAGATNAGMRAILFDVSGAYRETDLPRVESLAELRTKLRS